MSPKSKANLAVGGVLIGIGLLLILFQYSRLRSKSLRQEVRQEVAKSVLDNSLVPDSNGIVRLPPQYKNASCDGKAYVTRDPSGRVCIFFPEWRGKNRNCSGPVYVNRMPSPLPLEISLVGPNAPSPTGSVHDVSRMNIDRVMNAAWLSVSFRLD